MQNGKAANFYEVLSLDCSKFVGPDEIKKAYRCKALKFHPDACPPSAKEESTKRFLELRMAYETLSDPISQEIYDHELSLVDVVGRTRHGMSCSMGNKAARTLQSGRAANFYEILSLDCSQFIGPEEIKKAYRCKALKFHPDACPPSAKEESTKRFLELRMAYETLSDPISRELYDHELSLLDVEGRKTHGMNCCTGNKVWERQITELNKRSRQKIERRNAMGM
nr:uncharacterized protein LOC113736040 [Coffea arabica]